MIPASGKLPDQFDVPDFSRATRLCFCTSRHRGAGRRGSGLGTTMIPWRWDGSACRPTRRSSGDFDLDDSYPFADMLIEQMSGRIDSWAIRWRWTVFCAQGLSLYPPRSLANNIGFDATATHTRYKFLKRLLVRRDIASYTNSEPCPRLPRCWCRPQTTPPLRTRWPNSRRLTKRLLAALAR